MLRLGPGLFGGGSGYAAALGWEAPWADSAAVQLDFSGPLLSLGDGVIVSLRVNDMIFDMMDLIDESPQTWSRTLLLQLGDTIYFVVDPKGANYYDAVVVEMSVIKKSLVSVEPAGPVPGRDGFRGFTRIAPNPFAFDTFIELNVDGLPRSGVELEIVDPAGRLVRSLPLGPTENGSVRVRWDGFDGVGRRVSSGAYFAKVRIPGQVLATKLILCR